MASSLSESIVTNPPRDCQPLCNLFDTLFVPDYQTQLVRGKGDPLYLPANGERAFHQVIFAHGYFASALHEIAHWCIAGKARRQRVDYGYWYRPDGRSTAEQLAFERVEVKPQALEWIFSEASNHRFYFSADNLDGNPTIDHIFKMTVWLQVQDYLKDGLPIRAQRFQNALSHFYQTPAKQLRTAFPKPVRPDVIP